jgi:hypothetical protein
VKGMAEKILVNSDNSRDEFLAMAARLYDEHKHVTFSYQLGITRSLPQNSAAHLFFKHLRDALNDAGMEQHVFFKDGFFINWNTEGVKENIWRPVQVAVCGEHSTTRPTREQYIEIYDHVNRLLSGKGIHVPWPAKRKNK